MTENRGEALHARLLQELSKPPTGGWGGRDPDDVFGDDAYFTQNAGSVHTAHPDHAILHPQQMQMGTRGTPDVFARPKVKPWAHNVTERPAQQGEQMKLPGMPVSRDEDLSTLRQRNPHLNDYQFAAHVEEQESGRRSFMRSGSIAAYHKDEGYRGRLDWDHEDMWHPNATENADPAKGTVHGNEIGMIEVHPSHAGIGLGEAMHDYATMKGVTLVHSSDRSEMGDEFARKVGGVRLTRKRGKTTLQYGGDWNHGKGLDA